MERLRNQQQSKRRRAFFFEVNQYTFELTTQAPISNIKLVKQLGWRGGSEIAQQVIKGKYGISVELDNATVLILE